MANMQLEKGAAFWTAVAIQVLSCNAAITISPDRAYARWDKGIIPYRWDSRVTNFTGLTNVLIAMQQIEEFTGGCVGFRERTNEGDYLILQDESYTQNETCFSYVGKAGKWQPVRFSASCLASPGHAVHLLTRVIGLYPESNRPDRDKYISIQWNNIQKEKLQEYAIIQQSDQIYVFPGEYDFGSITHYSQNQFARSTSLKTWLLQKGVPHPGIEGTDLLIGQRQGLSIADVAAIRYLYGCDYSATPVPDLECMGDTSKWDRGTPAGWYFCKCHQNNLTGDTYFYGDRCQNERCTPACSTKPHTTCTVVEQGYFATSECLCSSGWRGTDCGEFYCKDGCLNGGVCVSANKCVCPPEYRGVKCNVTPKCKPRCENGGECISLDGTAVCMCQPSWSGDHCELPRCEQPCVNGGSCVAPDICECPVGYTGRLCENSNVTFGLPCSIDHECQAAWGDKNSYCNLRSSCPGVRNTCICKAGFERLPSGGPCRFQRRVGEACSRLYDVCQSGSECIKGKCECNTAKGWVRGPLDDCVKATKSKAVCSYFDDCLYNKICAGGKCACPIGMVMDNTTQDYTCRPIRFNERCSNDSSCKFVGVNAYCLKELNPDGSVKREDCVCRNGVVYDFLIDRYTIGKTCIPPYPQKWGERCSVDFSLTPQYGPCARGLVCELCPRTTDEYRCQDYVEEEVIAGCSANCCSLVWVLFSFICFYLASSLMSTSV